MLLPQSLPSHLGQGQILTHAALFVGHQLAETTKALGGILGVFGPFGPENGGFPSSESPNFQGAPIFRGVCC